jgi:hypothetical protein
MGRLNNASNYLNGYLDEIAIYDYALSATQISNQYNSGTGSPWWICQSSTLLNSSNWNFLETLYDGTNLKLFINGQQECSVQPGTTYSGTTANTIAGASSALSNYWSGIMATLNVFGTSNGVTPISTTNVNTDFNSGANRFRSTPIENIVTSGLILHLDAANAKQGMINYSNGCATSDLRWFDLSSIANNGILSSFNTSNCTGSASGWIGNGTTANPYAIQFKPTDSNAISLSDMNSLTDYTVELWAKYSTQSSGDWALFYADTSSGARNGMGIKSWRSTNNASTFEVYVNGTGSFSTFSWSTSTWTHLVGVRSGTTATLYLNGVQKATLSGIGSGSTFLTNVRLGTHYGTSFANTEFGDGTVATTRIYNRALNLQEIKQNCLAQQGRFGISSCAAP